MQSWRTLTIIVITTLVMMLVAVVVGWSEVALLVGVAGTVMLMLQRRLMVFALLLILPIVLLARQVQTQVTIAAVPAPLWMTIAERPSLLKCEDVLAPVPGGQAQASTANPAISAERGQFLVDVMLTQAMQRDTTLNEQAIGLAQERVTKLKLISAAFPDGQTHVAWYRSVVINRYPRAGLTIAYADATNGQPLMIVTNTLAAWDAGLECLGGGTFNPAVSLAAVQPVRQLAANYLVLLILGNIVALALSWFKRGQRAVIH